MSIVWIETEKCWGQVKNMMYGYSLISYNKYGFEIEEWFENDDLTDPSLMGIDYESDKDLL